MFPLALRVELRHFRHVSSSTASALSLSQEVPSAPSLVFHPPWFLLFWNTALREDNNKGKLKSDYVVPVLRTVVPPHEARVCHFSRSIGFETDMNPFLLLSAFSLLISIDFYFISVVVAWMLVACTR